MTYSQPASTATRHLRSAILLLTAMIMAGLLGYLGCQSVTASPSPLQPHRDQTSLGVAGGAVPDGVTAFDDLPAVNRLDPHLLRALQDATSAAAADGVSVFVNSGWRSAAYQDQLLADAIDEYGSEAEAARWVATAATSPHVAGEAVDVGEADATRWLSRNGARYGLCQIYRNEPWHYELRPTATSDGCPRMYADPTHDPRMQ